MGYNRIMAIHDRLRRAREDAGLSQGQVREYDGIDNTYLSKLEKGVQKPPTWPLLATLARRYGVSSDYLLELTQDPRPMADRAPHYKPESIEVAILMDKLPVPTRQQCLSIVQAISISTEVMQKRNERIVNELLNLIRTVGSEEAYRHAQELIHANNLD